MNKIIVQHVGIKYYIYKLWLTGNMKDGKNEVVPEEPGKMGYIQLWVKEMSG